MITKENLIEAASKLYENIDVEFVDGKNPYWDIKAVDPEEIDENITIAKLYRKTFKLEIVRPHTTWDLDEIFNELDGKTIREIEPEQLLKYIVDIIYDAVYERMNYYRTILEYLN